MHESTGVAPFVTLLFAQEATVPPDLRSQPSLNFEVEGEKTLCEGRRGGEYEPNPHQFKVGNVVRIRQKPRKASPTSAPSTLLAFVNMTGLKSRRRLLKESDFDASIRLQDAVRDSPTAATPTNVTPGIDTAAARALKVEYDDVSKKVAEVYSSTGRHRKWASAARGHVLGGKDVYFAADGEDIDKLTRLVLTLRHEILSVGLDIDAFNFDDPALGVHEDVNKLMHGTLTYMAKPDSVAEGFLQGTDAVFDRDDRRALVDLIKECMPPRQFGRSFRPSTPRCGIRPRWTREGPILAQARRLVHENRAADWTPTELARKEQLYSSLKPEFYAAVRQQADLGGVTGAAMSAAVLAGDDKTVIDMLMTIPGAVNNIENFVKATGRGGTPAVPPRGTGEVAGAFGISGGLSSRPVGGFQQGHQESLAHVPQYGAPAVVALDGAAHDVDVSAYGFAVEDDCGDGAVGVLGDEKPDRDDILGKLLARLDKFEAFIKTRRLGGGKRQPADSTAAYCQPVEECTPEEVHTLALCQVFQATAEDGASAFAAAVELHGAPAVVRAGAAAGGVDISAYGFSTRASVASGDDDIDVHEELRDLRQQIGSDCAFGWWWPACIRATSAHSDGGVPWRD
ncbi:hypothetical protein CYMTET_19023 [Cymbomonas tetramitiformis]|uniref:Uncharacterized protein n=1 Tax=Cymbomonas tetramitiformis TaxID=36881 RepID=A0AAE0G6Y6_9CHLO|nr:hypothetical protein CYMTET_19023 [Cymbomonas tetramitiformis]